MTKLAIAGATGRMGKALIGLALESSEFTIGAALEYSGSGQLEQDAGEVAVGKTIGVPIQSTVSASDFDVMVDFTTTDATMEHVEFCRSSRRAIMIGTTGLSETQKQQITAAAKDIPIILAANTSVGVNLCAALVETASRVIGPVTDIEIVESHHRHKVDAPSGTALFLGEAAARALGKDLAQDGVFSREGHTGARPEGSIGFATIRGGDIAGEHTVMFIGESERLEITHRATDRRIFARGALRAAGWLATRPAGFYTMADVLNLKEPLIKAGRD